MHLPWLLLARIDLIRVELLAVGFYSPDYMQDLTSRRDQAVNDPLFRLTDHDAIERSRCGFFGAS